MESPQRLHCAKQLGKGPQRDRGHGCEILVWGKTKNKKGLAPYPNFERCGDTVFETPAHPKEKRKRACAFDPRLRAPTPHPPGVGGCAGGFGPVRGRKAAAPRLLRGLHANALARLTPACGPHRHAPGRSRALRDSHARRVSAGAVGVRSDLRGVAGALHLPPGSCLPARKRGDASSAHPPFHCCAAA